MREDGRKRWEEYVAKLESELVEEGGMESWQARFRESVRDSSILYQLIRKQQE